MAKIQRGWRPGLFVFAALSPIAAYTAQNAAQTNVLTDFAQWLKTPSGRQFYARLVGPGHPPAIEANTFNVKCPASATVGIIGAPPSGWSIAPGLAIQNSGAYMPQPKLQGCNYPGINTLSGSLTRVVAGGVACAVNSDNHSFHCSNGMNIACPAAATIAYLAPMPSGWAGSGSASNSAGTGAVYQSTVSGDGKTLSCEYKGFAGALFQASPSGSTCTTGADHLSHDCTTPFVSGNNKPVADILPVLDSPSWSWLSSKIVFTNGDGTAYPYSSWSTTDRNRFKTLYQNMLSGLTGSALNISCPVFANQYKNKTLYYPRAQALDMYLAQVAHIFYIEATQKVPWSFLGFSDEMLGEMLGSKSLFSTIQPSVATSSYFPPGIVRGVDFQSPFRTVAEGAPSYVCDPDVGYRLMAGLDTTLHQNLIGPDRVTTLKNLSVWFSENVSHGFTANPTTASLLEDRLLFHDQNGKGIVENEGCHGGSNLFFDIARSVNLPIVLGSMMETAVSNPLPPIPGNLPSFATFTHAGLVFAWGEPGAELVMEHMDDINAMTNRVWTAVDNNGAPLSYDQMKQVFFNSIWRPSADLIARGLQYQSSLPWVIPGQGWGVYQRSGGWEDRPDFGRLLGLWQPNGQDESTYFHAYIFGEVGYDVCRWANYLEFYCEQSPLGSAWDWTKLVTPPPTGPYHTLSEHSARAAVCIQALGGGATGCTAAQNAELNFYSNQWGLDLVLSPP